ncbi:MAG: VacJ family lipoprotein [Alphaproteobacteria bacterium]|nr:VacJ family lipoprotein [Alphaproteobacteria bacterium]
MIKAGKLFQISTLVAALLAAQFSFVAQASAQQTVQPAATSNEYDGYDEYYNAPIEDPFETVNRGIFKFNEVFDTVLMKPVAKTYVYVVPQFGRDRVHNAVTNLTEPVSMLNGFLQGDPERGFTSMWRFIINSTLGVAGLFDFAGHNFDLTHKDEDFGQTMGVYGWGHGPYIVLPIFGPSSGRDAFGRVVDIFSNPFNYSPSDEFVYGRAIVTAIDARSRNLDLVEEIYRNSVDPYATIRSAYAQRRTALIRNNESENGDIGL